MSRSKDAAYRESGEAEYDEAGSPLATPSEKQSPATERRSRKLASVELTTN